MAVAARRRASGSILPPTPEVAALEEGFVSERVAASVETLLERCVPDAALLVIDDAHCWTRPRPRCWRRSPSGIAARRWLLVVAHRGEDDGYAAPEGIEALAITLAPLEPAAALRLVVELTEDAPLPAHVAADDREPLGRAARCS